MCLLQLDDSDDVSIFTVKLSHDCLKCMILNNEIWQESKNIPIQHILKVICATDVL